MPADAPKDDAEVERFICEYRGWVEQLRALLDDKESLNYPHSIVTFGPNILRQFIAGMRKEWKVRTGKDNLHQTAFGEPL